MSTPGKINIVHGHGPPPDLFSGVFVLARELRRQMAELMAGEQWALDAGFRPPCLGVIAVVAGHQPVSQRQIAEVVGIDASDVVGVLDILESAGFVERKRDPQDRRRHAVVLTAAGDKAAQRFAELKAEAEERVFGRFSEEERQELSSLLQRACERPVSELT